MMRQRKRQKKSQVSSWLLTCALELDLDIVICIYWDLVLLFFKILVIADLFNVLEMVEDSDVHFLFSTVCLL